MGRLNLSIRDWNENVSEVRVNLPDLSHRFTETFQALKVLMLDVK